MRIITALATFLCLSPALTAKGKIIENHNFECVQEFEHLVKKDKNKFEFLRATKIQNESDLVKLSSIEKHAYQIFYKEKWHQYFSDTSGGTNKVLMSQYIETETQKISGFRIDIITAEPASHRARLYYLYKDNKTSLVFVLMDKPANKRFWVCDGFPNQKVLAEHFIRQVANDVGEHFQYEETPHADNIRIIDSRKLPLKVLKEAQSYIVKNKANFYENHLAMNNEQYAIIKDNRVIGYVVSLWFIIDHPDFEGGGIHLYMDTSAKTLEKIEWWG